MFYVWLRFQYIPTRLSCRDAVDKMSIYCTFLLYQLFVTLSIYSPTGILFVLLFVLLNLIKIYWNKKKTHLKETSLTKSHCQYLYSLYSSLSSQHDHGKKKGYAMYQIFTLTTTSDPSHLYKTLIPLPKRTTTIYTTYSLSTA